MGLLVNFNNITLNQIQQVLYKYKTIKDFDNNNKKEADKQITFPSASSTDVGLKKLQDEIAKLKTSFPTRARYDSLSDYDDDDDDEGVDVEPFERDSSSDESLDNYIVGEPNPKKTLPKTASIYKKLFTGFLNAFKSKKKTKPYSDIVGGPATQPPNSPVFVPTPGATTSKAVDNIDYANREIFASFTRPENREKIPVSTSELIPISKSELMPVSKSELRSSPITQEVRPDSKLGPIAIPKKAPSFVETALNDFGTEVSRLTKLVMTSGSDSLVGNVDNATIKILEDTAAELNKYETVDPSVVTFDDIKPPPNNDNNKEPEISLLTEPALKESILIPLETPAVSAPIAIPESKISTDEAIKPPSTSTSPPKSTNTLADRIQFADEKDLDIVSNATTEDQWDNQLDTETDDYDDAMNFDWDWSGIGDSKPRIDDKLTLSLASMNPADRYLASEFWRLYGSSNLEHLSSFANKNLMKLHGKRLELLAAKQKTLDAGKLFDDKAWINRNYLPFTYDAFYEWRTLNKNSYPNADLVDFLRKYENNMEFLASLAVKHDRALINKIGENIQAKHKMISDIVDYVKDTGLGINYDKKSVNKVLNKRPFKGCGIPPSKRREIHRDPVGFFNKYLNKNTPQVNEEELLTHLSHWIDRNRHKPKLLEYLQAVQNALVHTGKYSPENMSKVRKSSYGNIKYANQPPTTTQPVQRKLVMTNDDANTQTRQINITKVQQDDTSIVPQNLIARMSARDAKQLAFEIAKMKLAMIHNPPRSNFGLILDTTKITAEAFKAYMTSYFGPLVISTAAGIVMWPMISEIINSDENAYQAFIKYIGENNWLASYVSGFWNSLFMTKRGIKNNFYNPNPNASYNYNSSNFEKDWAYYQSYTYNNTSGGYNKTANTSQPRFGQNKSKYEVDLWHSGGDMIPYHFAQAYDFVSDTVKQCYDALQAHRERARQQYAGYDFGDDDLGDGIKYGAGIEEAITNNGEIDDDLHMSIIKQSYKSKNELEQKHGLIDIYENLPVLNYNLNYVAAKHYNPNNPPIALNTKITAPLITDPITAQTTCAISRYIDSSGSWINKQLPFISIEAIHKPIEINRNLITDEYLQQRILNDTKNMLKFRGMPLSDKFKAIEDSRLTEALIKASKSAGLSSFGGLNKLATRFNIQGLTPKDLINSNNVGLPQTGLINQNDPFGEDEEYDHLHQPDTLAETIGARMADVRDGIQSILQNEQIDQGNEDWDNFMYNMQTGEQQSTPPQKPILKRTRNDSDDDDVQDSRRVRFANGINHHDCFTSMVKQLRGNGIPLKHFVKNYPKPKFNHKQMMYDLSAHHKKINNNSNFDIGEGIKCEHCGSRDNLKYYYNKKKQGKICSSCYHGCGMTTAREPMENFEVQDINEHNPKTAQMAKDAEAFKYHDSLKKLDWKNSWDNFIEEAPKSISNNFGQHASNNYIASGDWSPHKLDELVYLIGYLSLNIDHKNKHPDMLLKNLYALTAKLWDAEGTNGSEFDYDSLKSFNSLKQFIKINPGSLASLSYIK